MTFKTKKEAKQFFANGLRVRYGIAHDVPMVLKDEDIERCKGCGKYSVDERIHDQGEMNVINGETYCSWCYEAII